MQTITSGQKRPQTIFMARSAMTLLVGTVVLAGLAGGCTDFLAFLENLTPTDGQIACLDTPVPQVLIEVKFVTNTVDNIDEFGIELDLELCSELGQANSASFSPTAPNTNPVKAFQAVRSGCENQKLNQYALSSLSPAGGEQAGTIVLASLLDDTAMNTFMQALQQSQTATILSAPNVTATNGQAAQFVVGNEIPTVTSLNSTFSGELAQVDPFIQTVFTGPSFEVTPVIMEDNTVRLDVRPSISAIFNTPDVQTETADGPMPADRLLVQRSAEKITVNATDGQSLVLGGVRQGDDDVKGVLPFLKDVPIISRLFDNRQYVTDNTELLIFVTVRSVEPE